MALPEDFNPWEHLQSTVVRVFKKEVIDEFRDLGGEDWDRDIKVPRASLRTACTPDDNDTSTMTLIRMMLFYIVLRRAQDMQAPIYGMPVGQAHETRKFKPQICLFFKERADEVELGYRPLTAEIKFRLMDETEDTITEAKLKTLANKIKTEFGVSGGVKWKKGKVVCAYTDPEKGYKLHIFAYSESEGREIIDKVLSIQGHSPSWEHLTINENAMPASAYPTVPPTKRIAGKQVRLPRRRPVGTVRFVRATCAIWGLTRPVPLVDLHGVLKGTLAD